VLGEWRLGHLADAVLQVLSELVANAVTATERVAWDGGLPPVRLWLLGGPGAAGAGEVLVLVWDAVASEPAPRQASDLDESAGWRSWTASAAGSGTGTCRARRTAGRSPGHSSTARGAISRPARPARPGPRRASSSSPALPAAPQQLSLPAKTTENKEEVTE
jgi:hypothetical protein